MGKVVNLLDEHLELLNDDIEFYLTEIRDFLLDDFFEDILNVILKKMNKEGYNYLDDVIEFINRMEINKNLISKENFSILMATKEVIEDLLETYFQRLKIMSIYGLVTLWRDKETKETGLILNREMDVYDSLMIININHVVSQSDICEMPFKYVIEAAEYGSFEENNDYVESLLEENKEISPETIVRSLKPKKGK